jgi:hypothetical protein
LATSTVLSLECPSTRMTSLTRLGILGNSCGRFVASLRLQNNADTLGLAETISGTLCFIITITDSSYKGMGILNENFSHLSAKGP